MLVFDVLAFVIQIYSLPMGNCTGVKGEKTQKIAQRPVVSLQEDSMNCGLCMQEYEPKLRSPIMLCLNQHNACRPCVDRITQRPFPACPYCRTLLDSTKLIPNRILIEILQKRQEKPAVAQAKIETREQKMGRVLEEARKAGVEKIIYLIEVGADLTSVRELLLWDKKLSSIIDMSLFTNLKTLDLHRNHIQKITNLEGLKQLTFLNLGYNQIKRIEGLQSLEKLQFLDLCHNEIGKIENLSELSSLKTLNLRCNFIETVENLYQLSKLAILYLTSNPIRIPENKASIMALQHRGVILQINLPQPLTLETTDNSKTIQPQGSTTIHSGSLLSIITPSITTPSKLHPK